MLTNDQVALMLEDTLTVSLDETGIAADLAYHVKALAADREVVRTALADFLSVIATCCLKMKNSIEEKPQG